MNAMWGAGQMMFNKILVISDEGTKIQNYKALAQYISKNLNPATDIYFSTGPMDVLDHSCSKLGFGGKICIDGTMKSIEEADDEYFYDESANQDQLAEAFVKNVITNFPEIKSVNASLLREKISCVIISVEKNRKNHVRELHAAICNLNETKSIKLILYVEHTVNALDLSTSLWRFCNNMDPRRDSILIKNETATNKYTACMGLDGTRKTRDLDNFQRDWPNIIVADENTIKKIDEKWEQLGLGKFIPSPSIKFREQLYGREAAVN
jgi:4-hydroxy-3-polyprenylbenzoate decarboxylase